MQQSDVMRLNETYFLTLTHNKCSIMLVIILLVPTRCTYSYLWSYTRATSPCSASYCYNLIFFHLPLSGYILFDKDDL